MAENDFLNTLAGIVAKDRDTVADAVNKMEIERILDLLDAVSKGDEERARGLFDGTLAESAEISALFRTARKEKTASDAKKEEAEVEAKKEEATSAEWNPTVGDIVKVGENEGTVKIPEAPGNTVGIMIDGELTMVDRNDVEPLNECVIGMTSMPDLRRMQELAGMPVVDQGCGCDGECSCHQGSIPANAANPAPVTFDHPAQRIGVALDEIEREIADLRVSDLKQIRARLTTIFNKLNESVTPKG